MASFLHAADPGPFDLHPLVAERNFRLIREYWHRFSEQATQCRPPRGYTPLHVAVENGYYEIAEFLLQKYTPVDVPTSQDKLTPLFVAAENKQTECEILLVAYGANISAQCGSKTPLTGSDGQFIKFLREAGGGGGVSKPSSVTVGDTHPSLSQRVTVDSDMQQLLGRGLLASARLNYLPMVTKFVELGAGNISQAIHEAEDMRNHQTTALLLLSQAAQSGDISAIHSLYGESLNSIFVQSGVKEAAAGLDLRLPLSLARSRGHSGVYDELLVHQGVYKRKTGGGSEVTWNGLGIETLSGDVLRKIKTVTSFSAAHNRLTFLDSNIGICTKLCVLDLSHNYLKTVDVSLLELPSLKSLNLSHNFLEDLPVMKSARKHLTHLDLSSNRLNKVSYTVINFPSLIYLNLSHNFSLLTLPDWLAQLDRLDDLRIEGLGSLDVSLTRGGTYETLQFLKHRLQNTKQLCEMKMVIMGPAGGGKTRLINHMEGNMSTANRLDHHEGILINEIFHGDANGFSYNVWEISARKLTKSTIEFEHIFYTPRSMFLIVFSIKDELEVIKSDLSWRLEAIKRYATPSCVLLVATHTDQFPRKSDLVKKQQRVEETVKQICVAYEEDLLFLPECLVMVSLAHEPQNVHLLLDAVHRLASRLTCPDGHPFMGRPILLSALGLKGEIESFKRRTDNLPYLTASAMESLATNLKDVHQRGELQSIYDLLLEAGSFLYYPNVSEINKTMFFVDPNWFFHKVIMLLNLAKKVDTGFIHFAEFYDVLRQSKEDTYSDDDLVNHIMQVLCSYDIITSCKDEVWYIVPFLLPSTPPERMATDVAELSLTWLYKLNQPLCSAKIIKLVCGILRSCVQLPNVLDNETTLCFWSTGFIWKSSLKTFKIKWDETNTNISITGTTPDVDFVSMFETATEHLQGALADVGYDIEILCPKSSKKYFPMKACLQAIAEGETSLSSRNFLTQHSVEIKDLAPFLLVFQTCSLDTIQKACQVVKSPNNKSTIYYKEREVSIVKYKGLAQDTFRSLHYQSRFLQQFDIPCISNANGRLLAIALSESKSAALYLTPAVNMAELHKTLKLSPLVPLTLYRMGIELVKALTRLSQSVRCDLDFKNLQLWSTHSSALIHCSLAVPDDKLRDCLTSEINDTDLKSHWHSLMKQVRKRLFPNIGTPPHYLKKILAVCATPKRAVSVDQLLEALSSSYVQSVNALNAPHTLAGDSPIYCQVPEFASHGSVWMCGCNPDSKMIELTVIDTASLDSTFAKIKPFEIDKPLAMCSTNETVWVSTSTPNDIGCISIFDSKSKTLVHNVKMKRNFITCMTVMGETVCMGTKAGFLFMFPKDVEAIKQGAQPRTKFICEDEITGLIPVGDNLWIAHSHYIYFFAVETKSFQGSTYSDKTAQVGRLYGSADSSVNKVYSASVGGPLLLIWSTIDGKYLDSVDVRTLDLKSVETPSELVIASVAPILDTVWIGLSSGHIVIIDSERSVVSTLQPYRENVSVLCPIKPTIDSATPYYNVLSWGCGHIPPLDNFFTVSDKFGEGVLLLWDAYSCRTTSQMGVIEKSRGQYLDSYEEVSKLVDLQHLQFVGHGMLVPRIKETQLPTPTTERPGFEPLNIHIDYEDHHHDDNETNFVAGDTESTIIDVTSLRSRHDELVESCLIPSLTPTDDKVLVPSIEDLPIALAKVTPPTRATPPPSTRATPPPTRTTPPPSTRATPPPTRAMPPPTRATPPPTLTHEAETIEIRICSDQLDGDVVLTLPAPATLVSLQDAIQSHPRLIQCVYSAMTYHWHNDLPVNIASEDDFVSFLGLSPRPHLQLMP